MIDGHAQLAPSGASRWTTCTGSLAMEHGEPASCNDYTDEGTAAHALASMCLTEGSHPTAYLGRVLQVINGVYWPGDGPKPPILFGHTEEITREFEVDVDMVANVNVYVQRIREYAGLNGKEFTNQLYVEVALPIGHITGELDATGTGDAIIVTADGDELQAHDLKFGMGVQVYAAKNKQLILYLLGAAKKFPGMYKRYRAIIHQPRLNHLDEWDCTHDELMAFAAEINSRAKEATTAFEFRANWMGKDDTYLVPSEDACKFCKAKAKCPKLAKFVEESVGADFEELGAPINEEHSKTPELKAHAERQYLGSLLPTDLKALGLKLRCVDLIEDWCKAIRAKVEGALIEHANSPEAIAELGHKLIEGRKPNRAWADTDATEAALKKMRLKNDEMYTFKLISPSKAEAFFKPTPKRWAAVEKLIAPRPDGKPSVAPADHKSAALVLKSTADDFQNIGAAVTHDGSDLV